MSRRVAKGSGATSWPKTSIAALVRRDQRGEDRGSSSSCRRRSGRAGRRSRPRPPRGRCRRRPRWCRSACAARGSATAGTPWRAAHALALPERSLQRLGQVPQRADGGADRGAGRRARGRPRRVAHELGPLPPPPPDPGPAGRRWAAARRPGGRPDPRCARAGRPGRAGRPACSRCWAPGRGTRAVSVTPMPGRLDDGRPAPRPVPPASAGWSRRAANGAARRRAGPPSWPPSARRRGRRARRPRRRPDPASPLSPRPRYLCYRGVGNRGSARLGGGVRRARPRPTAVRPGRRRCGGAGRWDRRRCGRPGGGGCPCGPRRGRGSGRRHRGHRPSRRRRRR